VAKKIILSVLFFYFFTEFYYVNAVIQLKLAKGVIKEINLTTFLG